LGYRHIYVDLECYGLHKFYRADESRNGATIGFAIAVFGGALGCLLLLLKKSAAFYLFIASLLGVLVTMIHTLSIGITFGVGEIIGIILMPLVVAVYLIWYSKHVENKGWINAT
jgi:hypothetical protein